jgi:hypothetical protein
VRNPFRTEAEAFRFVIATILGFALIVLAAVVGGTWLGVVVFAVVTVVTAVWFFRPEPKAELPPTDPVRQADAVEDERRILVVANETVLGRALRECIVSKSDGRRAHVHVVSPALNSPLRHWVSDEDQARTTAQERLDLSVARLHEAGFEASGEIGDADPLQAIEDALRTFGPDEVIISTHPVGRSHWLERGIVESARKRFTCGVTHVVVDLETEREEVQ